MKNEPVAVVDHRQQNGVTWLKVIKGRSVMPEHNTLLYTHPVKELTDEEIWNAWIEAKHTALISGNFSPVEILFARAILKRASEK